MTLYPSLITDILKTVRYPGNGKNLVEAEMVEDDICIDGKKVSFSLIFEKPTDPFIKSTVRSAEAALEHALGDDIDIKGNITVKTVQQLPPKPAPLLSGVKNIIGVSSGKGGVGKSTVAANLAVALAAQGYKVGLLDADLFGPSMPKMFSVEGEQLYIEKVGDRDLIVPVEKYGVKILSIGFMVAPDKPVLWRGSMASNALRQLIADANWGELDYFIIDMPPGTSDIHLTLVQTLAISGVVVVSTPQEVALADARKGIAMFRDDKVNVPVLGIVENMAWFTPEPHPEEKYYIFGNGGAKRLAEELDVPLLAQIPLVANVCQRADSGIPAALKDPSKPDEPRADAFVRLALAVDAAVIRRNSALPPTQKVQTH
ncbi:MAG: Mrp/NBP35 family ATP-binding protein [Prevotella sp.]|nr:Mrp/NBP35 family ATP-binding protein [Prevotella sp.]MCM1075061.1 Mrp/NBP35 family ATP-binding protein [Ruminococcus sp.]